MDKVVFHLDLPPREELYKNLEIYKRDERRFYLRNQYLEFHIDLYDIHLYQMVDKYSVGDVIDLSDSI